MKLKIALDFDGVLVQTMEEWIRIWNKSSNLPNKSSNRPKLTLSDINKWDFFRKYDCSEDYLESIFKEINIENIPIINKKVPKYLKKLKKQYKIDIVTARFDGEKARGELLYKFDLMKINEGIHYDKLIIVPSKPYDYKITMGYDIYIDDSPELAKSFQQRRIEGKISPTALMLMPDRPWNWKIESHYGVVRMRNWKEIMKWLK